MLVVLIGRLLCKVKLNPLVNSARVLSSVGPIKMSTNKMYFRGSEDSDSFHVTFLLKYSKLNLTREFNFNRRTSEELDSFLDRLRSNLDKVIGNKVKRKQKKKGSDSPEIRPDPEPVEVEVTSGGTLVPGSTICRDLFFNGDNKVDVKFKILDTWYEAVVNSPWVSTLTLPLSMMADFPLYPNKVEILYGDKERSRFNWYRASLEDVKRDNWTEVGEGFVYSPKTEDIGCKLKVRLIPGNGSMVGPEREQITNTVVQAGPGLCPFHTRHAFTSCRLSPDSFRVVSYNILADVYAETEAAKTELFPYCPSYAMALDYRKQLYLKEILGYNADIVCLQEVDRKVFEYDLKHVLADQNLEGEFAKKGGTINEGIATFYSKDKFKCLESHRVVLGEEVDQNPVFSNIWNKIRDNTNVATRLKDKPTTVQILLLESLTKPNEYIVVGNTHLYFSPDADHIRLLQGGLLMNLLSSVVTKTSLRFSGSNVSFVICGDFNSVPECGIYQLMTTKHVPKDFIDWRSKEGEIVEDLELSQPYSIASACGTPEYTNFTVGFVGCLDYIYYQTDRLKVDQVVPLPSDEEFRQHTAIPSVVFPSDHVALVADLGWK